MAITRPGKPSVRRPDTHVPLLARPSGMKGEPYCMAGGQAAGTSWAGKCWPHEPKSVPPFHDRKLAGSTEQLPPEDGANAIPQHKRFAGY